MGMGVPRAGGSNQVLLLAPSNPNPSGILLAVFYQPPFSPPAPAHRAQQRSRLPRRVHGRVNWLPPALSRCRGTDPRAQRLMGSL